VGDNTIYIVGLTLIGFIAAVVILGKRSDRKLREALRERGERVEGRVIERKFSTSVSDNSDGTHSTDTYYSITYAYTVNGEYHLRRDSVIKVFYDRVKEGDTVEVMYLPENPKKAQLAMTV